MPMDDPSVSSSSGFQNAENVYSNSYEDLEEQSVPKEWEKRNTTMVILFFFAELRFYRIILIVHLPRVPLAYLCDKLRTLCIVCKKKIYTEWTPLRM
ncbi:hypothetical protein NPIL_682141 [Nephila pilipes]|uniref:Uncharacterized protein n=1 Tax=Nephila pilipes TaxID=299642 RepID=A0A8X6QTY6_NEPPI|nr:hypothetical protein NPIL_682141 [Nephila pilipes]